MIDEIGLVLTRILLALLAGALIGLERTLRGRPAGFRTHCLVCVASSLLMLLVMYQSAFMPEQAADSVRIDPTRMAQGVMTGIGFLGGGVIVKEGITVRGLTTAASIWMTAAIGITVGVGFYWPAALATAVAVGVLSVLRALEDVIPTQMYARLSVVFHEDRKMAESDLLALLKQHRIRMLTTAYRLENDQQQRMVRYEVTVRTRKRQYLTQLAEALSAPDLVHEFAITPTGD